MNPTKSTRESKHYIVAVPPVDGYEQFASLTLVTQRRSVARRHFVGGLTAESQTDSMLRGLVYAGDTIHRGILCYLVKNK